jgi:hypothetical protein
MGFDEKVVTFEELLMSQVVQQEALTRLLLEKGIFTKEDFGGDGEGGQLPEGNRMKKGKGLFGSFRVTLGLSILVGVIVPISMLGEFPEAIKWKMFIFIGILSLSLSWAIAFISWIITTFIAKRIR